jgi:hypothetical protein
MNYTSAAIRAFRQLVKIQGKVRGISFAGRAAPAPAIIEVAGAFDLYCR